ncbi:hypothetical protein L228DRAFT_245776 [Xylona heveae TC161]|uniref:F-box domain-containing protein n=1 Tax=Xylona heveae (strain CBS 132557 / TC161) TaxID=1328760 RepID=A0A165IE92_XYLHT|nr:hypothetical protein L228DRAFT_245776 [Xylona heveae TC161]KZF24771.1 hypothetical protein L228DRAFT_245776 [Xylona heveae TC161]
MAGPPPRQTSHAFAPFRTSRGDNAEMDSRNYRHDHGNSYAAMPSALNCDQQAPAPRAAATAIQQSPSSTVQPFSGLVQNGSVAPSASHSLDPRINLTSTVSFPAQSGIVHNSMGYARGYVNHRANLAYESYLSDDEAWNDRFGMNSSSHVPAPSQYVGPSPPYFRVNSYLSSAFRDDGFSAPHNAVNSSYDASPSPYVGTNLPHDWLNPLTNSSTYYPGELISDSAGETFHSAPGIARINEVPQQCSQMLSLTSSCPSSAPTNALHRIEAVGNYPLTAHRTDENRHSFAASNQTLPTILGSQALEKLRNETKNTEPSFRILVPSDLQDTHEQDATYSHGKRKAPQQLDANAKRIRESKPTRLRKGREVVAKVPMDVWLHILSFCPPRFLARARRINKAFHHALSYESAWRENRLQYYGSGMPGPLPGMKEWDYSNLLDGVGCMNCENTRIRKCYWAFQKRWCWACFNAKVMKVSEMESSYRNLAIAVNNLLYLQESAAAGIRDAYPRLMECIPHGVIDSWGGYESAGFYPRSWQRSGHSRQRVFLWADFLSILHEYKEFIGQGLGSTESKTEEEIEQWYSIKEAQAKEHLSRIQLIEDWVETRSREEKRQTAAWRGFRVDYFTVRAVELDPPITESVLQLMPAFKRAIEIAKPPSLRSWEILLPKLLQEREEAERAELQIRQARENVEITNQRRAGYEALAASRLPFSALEQVRLLAVADHVLERLQSSHVPDADFILVALRNVRALYYESCNVVSIENRWAHYRLLLDDARGVYTLKISPLIDSWDDPARIRAAKFLKCPGCVRNDIRHRFTFEDLFHHIHEKHACHVGDFRRLREEALPSGHMFPWCTIEWPVNLPALAEHHNATGRWDPDDDRPYVLAPISHDDAGEGVSAFEGRRPSSISGNAPWDFVENVVYAVTRLLNASLATEFKRQIAFEYGIRKMTMGGPVQFMYYFHLIHSLDKVLITRGLYDVFNHVKCGHCVSSPTAQRAKNWSKAHGFGELITHYSSTHNLNDWDRELLSLPSDKELSQALRACSSSSDPGAQFAVAVFDELFPLTHQG